MAFDIYRHEKLYRTYRMTIEDRDGQPVTDATVQAAVLHYRTRPTGTTTWTDVTYTPYAQPDADGYHGEVTLLFAGPDADPSGAIVVPPGGYDLYWNVVDTPETDAKKDERISVR